MPRITPEDIRQMSVEGLRAAAAKRLEELCGPLARADLEARVDKAVAEELEELEGKKRGREGGRRR